MSYAKRYTNLARYILPMPLTLAILLTLLSMLLAFFITQSPADQILSYWEKGFWDLLKFSVQMILMLVLGYVIALTKPVNALICKISSYCTSNSKAAAIIAFSTMVCSIINWGLGLIFGSILARKVAENSKANKVQINYPLIGASGYTGKMIWHCGFSASAPLKVNEAGHFMQDQIGLIPLTETIFSSYNFIVVSILLILIPALMYLFGRANKSSDLSEYLEESEFKQEKTKEIIGAEKLDNSRFIPYLFGALMLFVVYKTATLNIANGSYFFITPNFINFTLLGLGIVLFGNLNKFMKAVENSIKCSAGILVQYPLYAGIAGIIKYSGLIDILSNAIVGISTATTFPVCALVSAAIVNVFVPSGGGQWAVQGPILASAATDLGVPISKAVMALSYGDQLTNMIQPFWALPLLGITNLKAYELIPYTLPVMIVGFIVYSLGITFF